MSELIRYCSECGLVGEVSKGKRDCCPTARPAMIPPDIAVQAHAGFKAALALYNATRAVRR